jgi:hypothetical protein
MDADASHRHRQVRLFLLPLLEQGDGEEVPPQLEVGLDPKISLAQGDEGRNVQNPIRIQVLQLDLLVVQQHPEESVGRARKPMLEEGHEGHNVTVGRRRRILTAGHEPSISAVLAQMRLRLMRPSIRGWVTSEQYHKSMGSGDGGGRALSATEGQEQETLALVAAKRRRQGCGWAYRRRKVMRLFVGKGGAGGGPSAFIHTPATSRHSASLGVMRTLSLAAPSKDALDGGSPGPMGREPLQVRRDTGLKTLPRPLNA